MRMNAVEVMNRGYRLQGTGGWLRVVTTHDIRPMGVGKVTVW